MSDGSPTPPFHKKRSESFVMSSKGKALGLFALKGVNAKSVLNFDEVDWPMSKVTLYDVLKGNDEPIQVNKDGELVSGVINLLRLKALNPQLEFIEVTIVGESQLPPISEVSSAA